MATTDPDRTQTDGWRKGGWKAEGAGHGEGLHVRETLLIVHELTGLKQALVIRCFSDWWVASIEPWED